LASTSIGYYCPSVKSPGQTPQKPGTDQKIPTYPRVLARMPPAVRLAFSWLYDHSDQDGLVEATETEIAQGIARSRQTVVLALKRLEAVNLLRVERRRRGRGNGNIYVLNWAKPRKCKPLNNLQSSDLRKTAINDPPSSPERISYPWYRCLDETERSFADPGRLWKRAHRKFRVLFEHYLPRELKPRSPDCALGLEEKEVIQVAVGVIVLALRGRPKETWIKVYRELRRALRDHALKVRRWLAKGLRAFAAYLRKLVNQILSGKGLGWGAKRREEARERAERGIRRTEEYLREVERWREEALAQKEKLKAMPSIKDFATIEEWVAAVERWASDPR
jgi:hypothetical protein